jgi:thiol-disulfide isomerase/thioredoxin
VPEILPAGISLCARLAILKELLRMLTVALLLAAALAGDADLKKDGAFGFPQREATVLCDTPELRASVASDPEHLYVQAILWNDGDAALGETKDGREIGDRSSLIIDVDGDGKTTPNVDRTYALNPWPSLAGMHYQVQMGGGSSTGLKADSKGRGAVEYVEQDGKKVRVDSYLIPLAELGLKPGGTIRIAYHGNSTTPELIVNSVGFDPGKPYYAHQMPSEKYHELKLVERAVIIDPQKAPEGRGTIERAGAKAEAPKTGQAPPPVGAGAWLNWTGKEPPTLDSLKGKVVVVEFWATWCAPCVAGIPHLNELHDRHAKDGLVILSLTDQSKGPIETFVAERGMRYTVGAKSDTADAYGVTGIPHAFVVGRDGLLAWHGHPADEKFDAAIEAALKAK